MAYEISIESRFFICGISIDQPVEYCENLNDALNIGQMFKKIYPQYKHHSIAVREYYPLTRKAGAVVERF